MITTVVGNYPKIPSLSGGPNLRQAIARYDDGRITAEELAGIADQATIDAIKEQVEAGLDLVTDGQIRWEDPVTYVAQHLQGVTIEGLIRYFDTNTYYRQPTIRGVVKWVEPATVRDYQFAVQHSEKPVKAVLPGPYTLAMMSSDAHYGKPDRLVLDLAAALNQEAKALAAAGAPVIQFDEPSILRRKADFPLFKEAMAALVSGLSVKTALYTYFGDIQGLAPAFPELPFNVFGLDFVMGPGNYDAIQGFPASKELGFGIVDARNTKLETVEALVAAIGRVAQVVSPDRIAINPTCGLEFLPRRNAHNKLVRLVEGARKAQEVLG